MFQISQKYLSSFHTTVKTQKNSMLSKMATEISAILLNISNIAYIIHMYWIRNIAESDYNRPIIMWRFV